MGNIYIYTGNIGIPSGHIGNHRTKWVIFRRYFKLLESNHFAGSIRLFLITVSKTYMETVWKPIVMITYWDNLVDQKPWYPCCQIKIVGSCDAEVAWGRHHWSSHEMLQPLTNYFDISSINPLVKLYLIQSTSQKSHRNPLILTHGTFSQQKS
jgi:hypothetical protein